MSSGRCTALLLSALLTFAAAEARACVSCGCGLTQTLAPGNEVPFAGRLRLALLSRLWRVETLESRVSEWRQDLSVAWAPNARLLLSAQWPFQARQVVTDTLARATEVGPGEPETAARLFLFRDRDFAPSQLVSLQGGAKWPLEPRALLGRAPRSLDRRLGTGTVDPFLQLAGALIQGRFGATASLEGRWPLPLVGTFQGGASLAALATGQVELLRVLTLRGGAEGRMQREAREGGTPLDGSSGATASALAELLFQPTDGWMVQLGLRVPVATHGFEDARPLPSLVAALAVDL